MKSATLMLKRFAIPASRSRGSFAVALLAVSLLAMAPSRAQAQIVALVNGDPITTFDIAQRSRLIQISTQKAPAREDVLNELIDDKLKVQLGKRYIAEVPKREIESSYAAIARRAGTTPEQFNKMLAGSGISVDALKARIHADFVWGQIIRGKFRSTLQIGDHEVDVKLQGSEKKQETTVGFEYRLQPILLLVPKGAAPATIEARKRDAEGLRTRFQGCAEGTKLAMALPDVAVRDPITRQSADLPQQQRDILNNTPIGKLTPPDVTTQGVELFAVCNKTESKSGESAAKREAREAVFQERYQAIAKKYLKELRSQALIEMK